MQEIRKRQSCQAHLKSKPPTEQLIVDGVRFPPGTSLFKAHLALFRFAPQLQKEPHWRPSGKISENAYSGLGRQDHCRKLSEILKLPFEWHDFSIDAIDAFSNNKETSICGGGGTTKSTAAGLYALFFWMCCMEETAVLVASTSIDAARRRIWKNISTFFSHASAITGGLGKAVMRGNPRPHIRSEPTDRFHGIYVIPVAQGDIQKAIDAIKGFHPKRLLIVGDETDAMSQAIVDVCANLQIGTEEFQAIWLGNLPSAFNPLGKIMAPGPGQPVSEDLGVEWTSMTGAKCLRFDGENSPNIRDNGKWTGLIRQEDIDAIIKRWTRNSLQFWTMVKGLPAPEGVSNTVLSEATFTRFECAKGVIWQRDVIASVLLDPAFGGDRCAIRKIERGFDKDGIMRVLYHPPEVIHINVADPNNPEEYQINTAVQAFCLKHNVPPNEFAIDSTGTGRGAASVIKREWSPLINVCDFGGAPSEMMVSDQDMRPAKEAYDRKITELYFGFVEFVQAGMIRGLDPETAREFCQREFQIRAKKMSVETKRELKARGIPSPDFADNAVIGTFLLREKGVFAKIVTPIIRESNKALEREVEEQDFDAGNCYEEDYEVEEIYVD